MDRSLELQVLTFAALYEICPDKNTGHLPEDWSEKISKRINRQIYDINQVIPAGTIAGGPLAPHNPYGGHPAFHLTESGVALAKMANAIRELFEVLNR